MNQQKIGQFLKELRKEKGITQAEFSETLGVTNRSISRWETGTNMPDLDLLIQIANYYEVEISEILDGERKKEDMDKKTEETLLKVADYNTQDKMEFSKRVNFVFIAGLVSYLGYMFMDIYGLTQTHEMIASYLLGIVLGVLIIGVLYTSRYMSKIKAFKMRLLKRNC